MEGTSALFAVAMLVYAALWLNARANMSKFMGELRGRMQGALGRGSALGLFVIAFTAMLRESVETAIFLEGLSIDSPRGRLGRRRRACWRCWGWCSSSTAWATGCR